MQEIRGDAKSIRQLLGGTKYAIDYYQREYKWQTKQIAELLDDLTSRFFLSYEEGHERSAVEQYGHYFLGSLIFSDSQGKKFIIDGQQRLTTLTLLLIYLHNRPEAADQKGQIAELIFAKRYGAKSFNLDVDERTACLEALFNGEPFDPADPPESVRNILDRYKDINDLFPQELCGPSLAYFVDWLIENVYLVEITAYADEDKYGAYSIFEGMNDRGLSLAPTDMLKGYLLANITDKARKDAANQTWKTRIAELQGLGKEEDADCFKAWLRSQYASSIRERKQGARPQDFDRIGTEFHRWVRDHRNTLGLTASADFARFIEQDFAFYARQYQRLRQASDQLTPGLETVFYNAQYNFTLQYPVLLAPLKPTDKEAEVLEKLRLVGSFLDILIARRVWNWKDISYSTMQYAMFLVMRDIRGKSPGELSQLLQAKLAGESETFAGNAHFQLNGGNGKQIHLLLARMIDYLETRSGAPSRYREYIVRSGRDSYEIEHIWANHPERHADEFPQAHDFNEYRNHIGGLLLLPKLFNASYGDAVYAKKREHYLSQNLLARSLHEQCYQHNPGFLSFIQQSGLPFEAHPQFKRADLAKRQALYGRLAEAVWSPDRLAVEGQPVGDAALPASLATA